MPDSTPKIALITGSAQRIGAEIARYLHTKGFNLSLHYHRSTEEANKLQKTLNAQRKASVIFTQGDLLVTDSLDTLIHNTLSQWGKLDVLINNASSFYPTPLGEITEKHWQDLIGSNLKAPLFLSQAATPHLQASKGCIINIVDIHAEKPMRRHTVYSVAKAGLAALTRSLAKELAPHVRVNGVSPGAILWPEQAMNAATQRAILQRIALGRQGEPLDIAKAVAFLINAPYITGQIITVDGGRSLNL